MRIKIPLGCIRGDTRVRFENRPFRVTPLKMNEQHEVSTGSSASGYSAIDAIAGVSDWAKRIRRQILSVAKHNSGVLVTGPSGTGKELICPNDPRS